MVFDYRNEVTMWYLCDVPCENKEYDIRDTCDLCSCAKYGKLTLKKWNIDGCRGFRKKEER